SVAASQRPEDRTKRQTLTALVGSLKEFLDPDPLKGAVAEVRNRLKKAETLSERSIGAYKARRDEALSSIKADPRFRGVPVVEQVRLGRLGRNTTSGLWEFAVTDSGPLPDTDGHVSGFQFEESTAIVLILVPGGPFRMGGGPGSNENKVHDVSLRPFF